MPVAEPLRIPILCYHHIAEPPPGHPAPATYLSPARFRSQMAWLKRLGYRSVSIREMAEALRGERALPGRRAAITFDDGWSDSETEALPILEQAGFRATLFSVGTLGDTAARAFPESRDRHARPLLSTEQLRRLDAAGWEIGAHTLSHRHLTRIPPEEARREIVEGKRAIEDILGHSIHVFAYPYGDFNRETMRRVEEAGFIAACCSIPGRTHAPGHRHALRRVPVARDGSLPRFLHNLMLRGYRRGDALLRRRIEQTG